MILKTKKIIVFIVLLLLFIGLSGINTACRLINKVLEISSTDSQDKNIESKINEKIIKLGLSENIKTYLLKKFQNNQNLFEDVYSEYVFWEWLKSCKSATSFEMDTVIEIVAKDKFYSTCFIDSLLELNKDELSELLANDELLEKEYEEFSKNSTESFTEDDILFHIDNQTYLNYFPEDTKELIFLPEEIQIKAKEVIIQAIEVYPLGFVPEYLEKLYILGNEIKIEKVNDATALAINKTIFISNVEEDNEILYLYIFHHEFNHLLQDKYKELFNSCYEDWISNNPEGFKYYNYEPHYSNEDRLKMHENGFISPYSMINYSEDFAEIASYAFSKDSTFLNSITTDSKIKHKFDLLLDFYNKINPNITLEYFKEITGE